MKEHHGIIDNILAKRGIVSEDEVGEFLSYKPQKTYDPFLLLNMEAGVDLLLSEINAGSKICIYGDYDADGVTSVCVLSSVLSRLTDNFTYYLPSRIEEGYGLNIGAIAKLKEQGIDLLITVDCGSVSYEEVEFAKEQGMKVIVTDHHSIDDVKADCILINPKQRECRYPFKELAGCGVAFKLAQALQRRAKLPKNVINDVLDMVAIGTVGDVVSLTDENRTLVKYGLDKINSGSRKALKALNDAISLPAVKAENIAFGIAPHINAAGRMASAAEALELFLAEDDETIDKQVRKLIAFNSDRKKKQNDAFNECVEQIADNEDFIVMYMPDIHEGIGGIVAGKIKESVGRPVIIVTPTADGCLKGTGRSVPGVDIYGLLKKHSDLFERFGGHRSACGFLMTEDKLPLLKRVLAEDMKALLRKEPELLHEEVQWDVSIEPEEITLQLAEALELFEPCGQGNPRPAFLIKNAAIDNPQFIGQDGTHVRFKAVSSVGGYVDCILFKKAQEKKSIICGSQSADIIGCINKKSWRGRDSVQFIVEEIKQCN